MKVEIKGIHHGVAVHVGGKLVRMTVWTVYVNEVVIVAGYGFAEWVAPKGYDMPPHDVSAVYHQLLEAAKNNG